MTQNGPKLTQLIGFGSTIAGLVVGCTALGWFVDARLKTFPVFVLVGIALGIVLSCAYGYVAFRKFLEK
ncbi:MAG TPA: AtpZ/AtpI family protein [Pseudonocardiaceae bacterium]|jgi:F0F1-type ATP synthase assembly protein I|nr:AtpZ/AtpI family protein [Pseudonocardiaceae bacterium]